MAFTQAAAGARGSSGCGPGLTTVALAERLAGGEALGVDFAPAMVERAVARHGSRPGVAYAVDDAERLGQADAAFDVVTCSFALMYCYDAAAALGHMARAVRPGGRVLNVTAKGASVREAQARAYAAVDAIAFPEGFCRRDIGGKEVERELARQS